MSGEPPDRYKLLIIALLSTLFIIAFLAGFVIARGLYHKTDKNRSERQLNANTKVLIQGNTLVAIAPPVYIKGHTYGVLVDDTLDRIIECESNWNPNAKNPKSSAYGLCQMLKSTREYVERKWGMKIDWSDPQQQLYACRRLYEEEGCKHWEATIRCHRCY